MREANFLTDKSVLVTIPVPVGTTVDSNQLKIFFSTSQTNCLYGKVVNRIRFVGVEGSVLEKVNGVGVYAPYGNTSVYISLKDKFNNVLLDRANLLDYSEPSTNIDPAGRNIYAPVRRMCLKPDWQKSYLTLTTVAPVTFVVDQVITLQISYTN